MLKKAFVPGLLWFLSCGPLVLAQGTTGTISGTVTDTTGAVIPGSSVVILNEETGISRTVPTDAAGRYLAPSLGLGQYRVTASHEGFQKEVRSGITLTVDRQAVVNFQLQVGAVTQTVEVVGEAPLVDTVKGGLSSLVETKAINDLPLNGRDLAQLITLQMGAEQYTFTSKSVGEGGKLLVIGGGRTTANVFYMDGIIIESFSMKTPTGTSGNFLGAEGVQEFRVETNAYSAQYGRSAGGAFNVVTKGGTNTLHGSAFEFLRNSTLDAARWEDNAYGSGKAPFKRNQFGFSLGGRIVKDRTFYFGTYEGLRQAQGSTIVSSTFNSSIRLNPAISPVTQPYLSLWPLPNGANHSDGQTADYVFGYNSPTNEDYYQGRVDHRLSDKDSLFGRYTVLRSWTQNVDTFPATQVYSSNHNQYSTLEYMRIFSPTLLNTARFGFTRTNPLQLSLESQALLNPALFFVPGKPLMGQLSVTNVGSVGQPGSINGTPGQNLIVNSFQWGDDVVYNRGRSVYKFGFLLDHIQLNGWEPGRDEGAYSFGSVNNFLFNVTPSQFRGTIVTGSDDPYRSFKQNIIGMYFEDGIKVTPRLTWTLGLRYEFITVPVEKYGRAVSIQPGSLAQMLTAGPSNLTLGNPMFQNPSHLNFAPRVGFAWDMMGDGKTSLRGGFGIYFGTVDQAFNRTTTFRSAPLLIELTSSNNVPFPNIYQLCSTQNPYNPTNAACSTRPVLNLVPYSFSTPYVMLYNLNFQREILRNTVFTAAYAGSRGVRLLGIGDVNADQAQAVNGRLVYPASATARPNANFNAIEYRHPCCSSFYNSLQLNVTHKYAQGLQLSGSYTYARSIDTTSGSQGTSDFSSGDFNETNYYFRNINKSLSTFDVRNAFNFSSTYELPFGPGKMFGGVLRGVGKQILAGWQVGGIVTLHTGFPGWVSVTNRFATQGQYNDSPDLVAGASNNPTAGTFQGCALFPATAARPAGIKLGGPDLYFNPCAFTPAPANTVGNVGRNTVILPGQTAVDVSLSKNFALTETKNLQFRFEGFNFFNHPNFYVPSLGVFDINSKPTATPGRITSTVLSSRQIQLGLKLTF